MGNPLLDIQVVNQPELLEKYNLKPNDAVLAEGKQHEMCVLLLLTRCFLCLLEIRC